jgi:predicted kinase
MTENKPTLHLLVGKIAAGKSTRAAELGRAPGTVVVSEDQWLAALFGDEQNSIGDYVRCSARLRTAMEPHLIALLQSGLCVVLDFPANTIAMRTWVRRLLDKAGCAHKLHFLDIADDVCRERLHERNAAGNHAFSATDEQFDLITRHFVAPSAEEGFQVVVYHRDETGEK